MFPRCHLHSGSVCVQREAEPALFCLLPPRVNIPQAASSRPSLSDCVCMHACVCVWGGGGECARGPCQLCLLVTAGGKKHTRAGLNIVASYHSNGMVIHLSSLRHWWERTGHAAMLFIYAFTIQLFHPTNKEPSCANPAYFPIQINGFDGK